MTEERVVFSAKDRAEILPLTRTAKTKARLKPAAIPPARKIEPRAKPLQRNVARGPAARQRVPVQSLGRALASLEEIARHRDGIGVAELSKMVGLHNSTAFHLAKTLVSLGSIRQERDSKRYRIGLPL